MWGRCQPTECDWGETTAFQDPKDNSTWVSWTTDFSVTDQKLTLVSDVLVVTNHTRYTDTSGRAEQDLKEVFMKGLVHDWSDNGTGSPPPPVVVAAQKPVPPAPKPKREQKMLDWSSTVTWASPNDTPNVRFQFRTTVATAPIVYLSERVIDGKHIDPKLIVASKTGPAGTVHNIQINLPEVNKTKSITSSSSSMGTHCGSTFSPSLFRANSEDHRPVQRRQMNTSLAPSISSHPRLYDCKRAFSLLRPSR